ncbi:MAG: DUF1428 domain-containing protein [Opitutales bacterium]|nr:DUF1428 domain-containing protein [Opitutales bacterium]
MSKYIDGFVLPIPKDKLDAYRATAEKAAKLWKEHGALEYVEAVGDDLEAESMMEMTPFPRLAGTGPDETVVFAYIVYKSREHRDAVNAKVMADPRIKDICPAETEAVFDMKRMAYGGFRVIVES